MLFNIASKEMKCTGMVPVFYHTDVEIAKAVLEPCYKMYGASLIVGLLTYVMAIVALISRKKHLLKMFGLYRGNINEKQPPSY